ncbi:MAG: T9SS type A sorting domain-containing protein [Ignavibacteria bacterium]|jgi:hypothetical protein|nr:T9SS type A sorting domain-containing protein [Ignavibacteria bacterium]MCU7504348.1 T9SS type A sorting domain-containing protein [Ignavibacteria bacterium]MCU7517571.1 T9SS type A sorting domain-containing protein [Ignavibacteria bacterium]
MMKRLLFVVTLVLVLSATAFSQWTLTPFGTKADSLMGNSGAHGVAVDPDGKIWVELYKPASTDTVLYPETNKYVKVTHIYVFNPDGTQASFSPIKSVTIEGKVKPLDLGTAGRGGTGLARDKDGNMIASVDFSLYKINYKTGEGMAKYQYPDGNGITRAACDTLGNVFIAPTVNDHPLIKLDADLANPDVIMEKVPSVGRNLEVSPDGNTIYLVRHTGPGCFLVTRPSEYYSYELTDTVFAGWKVEGIVVNPVNRLLYVSAGSYQDKPIGAPYSPSQQDKFVTIGTYYGVNPRTFEVVDSLAWKYAEPNTMDANSERNRGIAFSNDGKTAYLIQFNASSVPVLQRYVTNDLVSSVNKEKNAVVENYSLSQNYPNPFNPTTQIKFSVAKDGFVSLKVYDILGKEAATLVNSQMTKGTYSATLDGKNLTSGIYIYQLNANGVVLSKKMTLMK